MCDDVRANALAHGADIDFHYFYKNPGREYRVRKALQFESEMPWLEYILVRCRRERGDLILDIREVQFRDSPFDSDIVLARAWQRREQGELGQ